MTEPSGAAVVDAATRPIPTDFVLGVATAAYQIEGAAHADGRTDSIWDVFSRVPGAVAGGDTGDVACDHYHRFRDDIALMADMGVDAYRFSTSWARVRPDGGPINRKGLDFYSRLVDELLDKGIAPWLTLYHWDLPQALEEKGGWANRDTASRFVEYVEAVHGALGDRVASWTTLNEPWCSAFLGYLSGDHAPGRHDPESALAAGHHLLLAHGLATRAIREFRSGVQVGITLYLTVPDPVDPTDPDDVEATRLVDAQLNRFFLDPIFRGAYPSDLMTDVEPFAFERRIRDGDLAIISSPIDFLGVNYYRGEGVSARPDPEAAPAVTPTGRPSRSPFPIAEGIHLHSRGLPRTGMDWEIQPEGLTRLLRRLGDEYAGDVAMYVTENGAAFDDAPDADGFVDDVGRTRFLRDHLAATLDARDAGANVQGYFYWSFMDNFEWEYGYDKRFGLVRVDYPTQARTPKASAREYRRMISGRSL